MSQPVLEIDQVEKNFGAVRALARVSVAVAEGEFFALLGSRFSGAFSGFKTQSGKAGI